MKFVASNRAFKRWSWQAVIGTKILMAVTSLKAQMADVEPVTFWKRIEEKGLYERIWERLRLYENEENSVLQALSVIGRYNGQYWSVSADQGSGDGWENRRIFIGAEAVLFHNFTVQAQIKVSEDFDPFYDGLFQALVKWSPGDSFSAGVGRVDLPFIGMERSTSSTKIATFERGLLVDQLMPGEVVGAVAEGNPGDFSWRAAIFSGTIEEEFSKFDGGVGLAAGVGYKLPLFYEAGSLHLEYLFNDGNPANNAMKPYDHIVSLWHQGQVGSFSLGVDLTCGHGLEERAAVFGVTVLPTIVFARNVVRKGDALQAVLRYQFAVSDGDNGLQLRQRYEQEVIPAGLGDSYHAVYGGVNYLIFGDRLKLMTGVEYSSMRDSAHDGGEFAGWTYLIGVRVYF